MFVREARREDIEAILNLMRQLIDMHNRLDWRYKRFREYRGLKQYIAGVLKSKKKKIFVGEEKGKIIGYLIAEIETAPYYFRVMNIAKIADAAVDAAHRRQGTLRQLFLEAERWFIKRGFREVELNVDAKNIGAVGAWEALGFKTYKLRMRKTAVR